MSQNPFIEHIIAHQFVCVRHRFDAAGHHNGVNVVATVATNLKGSSDQPVYEPDETMVHTWYTLDKSLASVVRF